MIKKTVVFLRSNPVDPDSRVEKEVNSLLKAGYNVKILAWDRSMQYKVRESYLKLEDGKPKIYRFGIPATFGGGIKNLKAFIIFQIKMLLWLIKNKKEYNIIHACDFDTGYTAYNAARILNKRLVFDIFDYLFTDIEGRFKPFKRYIVYLQHKIINYADGTIICTEQREEQIKGSKPKNLTIIHNSPPQIDKQFTDLHLNNKKTKIAYVGILQDHRFLKELAEVIKVNNDWELHIGGFGKYENYFEKLADKYNNIIYYGKLPYNKALELEHNCDIMTAIYDPSIGNHYYAAPNKFYEALMLGKPLIMVKGTGMYKVVKENEIGELMDYNISSLNTSIENLSKDRLRWPEISVKMKELYIKDYSWNEMEKRLIDLYDKLI